MLTAGDSGRSLLQVYDPNGSLLYKRSTKSHYLSACAVSPDGSHAAAVALGQADITFSASLQLYRTDSEEIAAECALDSEMPYDIAFVTDSVVCAVSEDRVRFFAADGTERGAYVAENGRIADYHFGGDGFVTVLVDPYETSSRAELITLQPDGSVLAQLSLGFMPVSLSACGSYVGILTAEKALLYTSALEPVAQTEQDGTAVCILARSDGTALLAGTGTASPVPAVSRKTPARRDFYGGATASGRSELMKPTICSRCKKNIAVIFITKVENGVSTNEGLCLKCARELKIKQVDDIVERMGITDEDLDNLNGEMMAMMQPEPDETDEDDIGSRTATFPHMNRLFGNQGEVAPREEPKETQNGKTEKPKVKKHKFLDTYCLSLTGRARAGELDKVVGREVETERVVQILNRRQKNNPCLIGEPGVGKTAIAEGLAQRIVDQEVPYKLQSKEVYLMDLTALVAGTQFRGQFESRMKSLIDEVKKLGNIILVIDEVHNLVGAGDAEGSMNAANILKPALSRGEIQVIGATTFDEYRKYIEKDSALERRFQP